MEAEELSIVYVLTNPAMPGLVKIGKTTQSDPGTRVAQLYSTGVPVPFQVEFACRVTNPSEVERALHEAFSPQRINPRREFFEIEPEQAIAVLRLLHIGEDATEEISQDSDGIELQDKQAADRLRSRKPNLDFENMGIPIGAFLQSNRTEDTVEVIGPKRVRFRGTECSLSSATQEMMEVDYALRPNPYWTYEGRSLGEIYEETYGVG